MKIPTLVLPKEEDRGLVVDKDHECSWATSCEVAKSWECVPEFRRGRNHYYEFVDGCWKLHHHEWQDCDPITLDALDKPYVRCCVRTVPGRFFRSRTQGKIRVAACLCCEDNETIGEWQRFRHSDRDREEMWMSLEVPQSRVGAAATATTLSK